MSVHRWLAGSMLAIAAIAAPWAAHANDTYPDRPVRLVVPFAPGGSSDIVGRVFGEYLHALRQGSGARRLYAGIEHQHHARRQRQPVQAASL